MARRMLAAALLLATAGLAAWWVLERPRGLDEAAARAGLVPGKSVVYRWRGPDGTLHVSDHPPRSGVPYERLEYRHDVNVLPPPPEPAR